jgi:hypothetical protein
MSVSQAEERGRQQRAQQQQGGPAGWLQQHGARGCLACYGPGTNLLHMMR